MNTNITIPRRLAAAFIALASSAVLYVPFTPGPVGEALARGATAAPASLPPQTNADGGVTVTVTPRPTGKSWEFEVALTTHSGDLSQDLAKVAYLVDPDTGDRQLPLAWQGSPPGGHHRKGVLSFANGGKADALQLHIDQIGGVASRTFVWRLK